MSQLAICALQKPIVLAHQGAVAGEHLAVLGIELESVGEHLSSSCFKLGVVFYELGMGFIEFLKFGFQTSALLVEAIIQLVPVFPRRFGVLKVRLTLS